MKNVHFQSISISKKYSLYEFLHQLSTSEIISFISVALLVWQYRAKCYGIGNISTIWKLRPLTFKQNRLHFGQIGTKINLSIDDKTHYVTTQHLFWSTDSGFVISGPFPIKNLVQKYLRSDDDNIRMSEAQQ